MVRASFDRGSCVLGATGRILGLFRSLLAVPLNSLPHSGHDLLGGGLGWVSCQEAMAASGLEVFVDEVRLVLLPITLAEQEVNLLLAFVGACP